MSLSSGLYRLQQIDTQLDQLHARLREIEAALNDPTVIRKAELESANADDAFNLARKNLRQAEEAVGDQQIKISQNESALYGGKVRNPKELQDLQNEVAALKRYLSVLEDRQLEAMLAQEEAEANQQQVTHMRNTVQAQQIEQHAGLRGEQTELMKSIERLELERRAGVNAVADADLTLYEQLRQKRRGVAISKILNSACNACGALLTPALIQAASAPSQLTRCTSCGRILYAG
jgi:predicted  nucleic acid-binding Zn-ribbon protein